MKSNQLQRDLKTITENKAKIKKISKGDVSGASIEIEYSEPASVDSYVYYTNAADRDADYVELNGLILVPA